MGVKLNSLIIACALLLSAGVCGWAYKGLLADRASRQASVKQSSGFVITHGGTYRGAWRSDDPDVAAVVIQTKEPVIIDHSIISSRGDLIVARDGHANLTVRDCVLSGMNPNLPGRRAGRALVAQFPSHLVVDHNTMQSTGGIYVQGYTGDPSAPVTLQITANSARNIDGRASDGRDGFDAADHHEQMVQFAQLDKVQHVGQIQIAWNQVINDPGLSRVEDNISIYESSGTSASPIDIHDNYIQGAFPVNPQSDGFSGGGIMLGDGVGKDASGDPGFVRAHDNQVLATSNYGIAISSGHDLHIDNNRVIASGIFGHGQVITSQNVGIYINDAHHLGKERFARNTGSHNVIGWQKGKVHNDSWTPDAASWTDNQALRADLLLLEQQESAIWAAKLLKAKQTPGARSLATTHATIKAPDKAQGDPISGK